MRSVGRIGSITLNDEIQVTFIDLYSHLYKIIKYDITF